MKVYHGGGLRTAWAGEAAAAAWNERQSRRRREAEERLAYERIDTALADFSTVVGELQAAAFVVSGCRSPESTWKWRSKCQGSESGSEQY